MMIKDFGGHIATVWDGLRPMTKKMLVGALRTSGANPSTNKTPKISYDANADWEVSRLLTALDEQSRSKDVRANATKSSEIAQLAETCVRVLENQTASAEVFIQLAERAIKENDYNKLDKLADLLVERFAAGEVAEIVRQSELPQIRAIAFETLAMMPISSILPLLDDQLYAAIGANALDQKAFEFDSEEARDILEQFESENEMVGE